MHIGERRGRVVEKHDAEARSNFFAPVGGLGGNVLSLNELESIGKLFSAKPADADARRKELEEKILKLTEELERSKSKN
jgi:hypothetical protein